MAGRKKTFKNEKELSGLIDGYFASITITKPRVNTRHDGEDTIIEQVLTDDGDPVMDREYIDIPSILGLCEYLDIHRCTLLEYEADPIFTNTIKKAKQKIEKYSADALFKERNVTGIIFNLKNNFGWVDKTEVDSNLNGNITISGILKDIQGMNSK